MRKLTPVFYISFVIALLFIIWGIAAPSHVETVLGNIQGYISEKLGWFYLLSATAFVIFAIYLIFSPYGRIKLGKPDEKPEYNYFTWFAFLFTAGMGIGLVFWGVAEPLYHYYGPPAGEPESDAAAAAALRYSFFHWGIHPWAIYSIVALALAYFKFRHDAPGVVSAALRPVLGDKVDGPLGTLVNVLVVFATIFGVATSLGLGAAQVSGGLSYLFDFITNNLGTQLVVIAIITVLYLISAGTGINRGIRILSMTNIILAIGLMLFVLAVGPTVYILDVFTTTLGSYIQNLPSMSFSTATFIGDRGWLESWTIFYWAWWIAWSPFVGTFIARVSRGRTIREFVLGVLAVPTLFGGLWFSVFGATGMSTDNALGGALYNIMGEQGEEIALFSLLDQFPLSGIIIALAILLIISFFITSADSATFVLGMQTTNGSLNPPTSVKMVWGAIQSSAAAVLLYFGGLAGLEMAMIIAALPFTFVMLFMVVSIFKALKSERQVLQTDKSTIQAERNRLREEKERLKQEKAELKKQVKASKNKQ
ncbi:glycine betaine transporter [Alteribacillus persepolensis]|uniref:Glycine betaine transporter n=1 Tax=Alteribacillus persepolensis TaxID=568899 RepID=A0A1G7Y9K9_9BACI|nr:BCCT family transporter [Alteribacillus persepolensis]SDG93132.1 glycine betaine transporter [Alteribacillus persepolensis]